MTMTNCAELYKKKHNGNESSESLFLQEMSFWYIMYFDVDNTRTRTLLSSMYDISHIIVNINKTSV